MLSSRPIGAKSHENQTERPHNSAPDKAGPPAVHWRVRRADHHEPRRDALIQLWKEKRGEAEPEDLSGNLVVQPGVATEALNQTWPRPLASIPLTSLPPGRANELHSPRKTRPGRL